MTDVPRVLGTSVIGKTVTLVTPKDAGFLATLSVIQKFAAHGRDRFSSYALAVSAHTPGMPLRDAAQLELAAPVFLSLKQGAFGVFFENWMLEGLKPSSAMI